MKAITSAHVSKLLDKLAEQQDISRSRLDALRTLLAFTGWDDPCMDMNVPHAVEVARAAIAKAEVSQ